jgi:hypothetical protein
VKVTLPKFDRKEFVLPKDGSSTMKRAKFP